MPQTRFRSFSRASNATAWQPRESRQTMEIQDYQTPAAQTDFPFLYIYDATDLVDGSDYQNVQVLLQGDSEFRLRAIRGLPELCRYHNHRTVCLPQCQPVLCQQQSNACGGSHTRHRAGSE